VTAVPIAEFRKLHPFGGDLVRARRYDWPEAIETRTYYHHYDEVVCLVTQELTDHEGKPYHPEEWIEFQIVTPRDQETP